MKKYLLCIASFEGEKQIFFDKFISPRNKEFALVQGYEYIEIKEKQLFRNSGTWLKLYNVKKLGHLRHVIFHMFFVQIHKHNFLFRACKRIPKFFPQH